MVELGLAQQLALLLSRDTASRLEYVLTAVNEHLKVLQVKVAVMEAVPDVQQN